MVPDDSVPASLQIPVALRGAENRNIRLTVAIVIARHRLVARLSKRHHGKSGRALLQEPDSRRRPKDREISLPVTVKIPLGRNIGRGPKLNARKSSQRKQKIPCAI